MVLNIFRSIERLVVHHQCDRQTDGQNCDSSSERRTTVRRSLINKNIRKTYNGRRCIARAGDHDDKITTCRKKFDYLFSSFDTIPGCDERTDTGTDNDIN